MYYILALTLFHWGDTNETQPLHEAASLPDRNEQRQELPGKFQKFESNMIKGCKDSLLIY